MTLVITNGRRDRWRRVGLGIVGRYVMVGLELGHIGLFVGVSVGGVYIGYGRFISNALILFSSV